MPSTTAGVAVTASSVVKNHSWRRSPTVSGEIAVSQADEKLRSSRAAPRGPVALVEGGARGTALVVARAAERGGEHGRGRRDPDQPARPPMAANLTLTSRS